MTMSKLVTLVRRLHERTTAGEIDWERTPHEGSYQCSFTSYVMQIRTRPSRHEEDALDYVLLIMDDVGRLIESVDDEEFTHMGMEDAYAILVETYNLARRRALGTDAAIEDLLRELEPD